MLPKIVIACQRTGQNGWKELEGLKLESVQLTKDGEYYLSDSVVFNFGAERRVVSISPADGLIIDFFED